MSLSTNKQSLLSMAEREDQYCHVFYPLVLCYSSRLSHPALRLYGIIRTYFIQFGENPMPLSTLGNLCQSLQLSPEEGVEAVRALCETGLIGWTPKHEDKFMGTGVLAVNRIPDTFYDEFDSLVESVVPHVN